MYKIIYNKIGDQVGQRIARKRLEHNGLESRNTVFFGIRVTKQVCKSSLVTCFTNKVILELILSNKQGYQNAPMEDFSNPICKKAYRKFTV